MRRCDLASSGRSLEAELAFILSSDGSADDLSSLETNSGARCPFLSWMEEHFGDASSTLSREQEASLGSSQLLHCRPCLLRTHLQRIRRHRHFVGSTDEDAASCPSSSTSDLKWFLACSASGFSFSGLLDLGSAWKDYRYGRARRLFSIQSHDPS